MVDGPDLRTLGRPAPCGSDFQLVSLEVLGRPRWQEFVDSHPDSWYPHCGEWCVSTDRLRGRPLNFAVTRSDGKVVAVVPASASPTEPRLIVSGLLEPAGALIDPALGELERREVWTLIAGRLRQLATSQGAAAVLVKTPVLGQHGIADTELDRELARSVGFTILRRDFFCLDCSEDTSLWWQRVSPRTRTQIRRAGETTQARIPSTREEEDLVLSLYADHARRRDKEPGLTRQSYDELVRSTDPLRLHPLLFLSGEQPVAFSLSLGLGASASLYAWGTTLEALHSQVAKFAVWETLVRLHALGYGRIEYGGMVDDPAFSGITEFYRRLGGFIQPGWWAWDRVQDSPGHAPKPAGQDESS